MRFKVQIVVIIAFAILYILNKPFHQFNHGFFYSYLYNLLKNMFIFGGVDNNQK